MGNLPEIKSILSYLILSYLIYQNLTPTPYKSVYTNQIVCGCTAHLPVMTECDYQLKT